MNNLYEIASAFRLAIEDAVMAGEIREMRGFPTGCCSYASNLLQRFLFEQYTLSTWYMSGRYGYGWNAESHAWLETQDGVVIDITGDQYKFKELNFIKPVYVGPRADGFHDQFELDAPITYSKNEELLDRNTEFNKRYEIILNHLRWAII